MPPTTIKAKQQRPGNGGCTDRQTSDTAHLIRLVLHNGMKWTEPARSSEWIFHVLIADFTPTSPRVPYDGPRSIFSCLDNLHACTTLTAIAIITATSAYINVASDRIAHDPRKLFIIVVGLGRLGA